MWSGRKKHSRRAGFTLIEVLVAVVVAIVLGGALARFFGGVRVEAQRSEDRLGAWTVARAVLADVPSGEGLAPGSASGTAGAYSWRRVVTSAGDFGIAGLAAAAPDGISLDGPLSASTASGTTDDGASAASGSDETAADEPTVQWLPYRVLVEVTGARGGSARLETVRLGRIAAPAPADAGDAGG